MRIKVHHYDIVLLYHTLVIFPLCNFLVVFLFCINFMNHYFYCSFTNQGENCIKNMLYLQYSHNNSNKTLIGNVRIKFQIRKGFAKYHYLGIYLAVSKADNISN